VDLDLPAPGFSWTIARSYNPRQATSAGVHRDSAGPQGNNWFQMSQPELALYDADGNAATRGADDLVYLVYGADRYIEFKRSAENSDVFKAVNGAAGGLVFTTISGVTLRGEQSEQPPKDSEEGPPE